MPNKKYRVLHIVSHPIQYQAPLFRLVSNMSDIELFVLFYWDKKEGDCFDLEFQQKIVWDVPLLEGYQHDYLSHQAGQSKLKKFILLWKRINRKKFDIVWTHGYADLYTLFAIFFARLKGLKVFVRGDSAIFPDDKQFRARFMKRKLAFWFLDKFVDIFLAVGTENKKFYLQQGVPDKKIILCHYTVDNNFFYQKYLTAKNNIMKLKQDLHLEAERPIILYASKFIKRKYPIDLVIAYQNIYSKLSPKPYLLFIGAGETEDAVKQAAKKIDGDVIRFLGFKNQTELPDYFAIADIFVLPAIHENWGLVINEAMNAECAIVVTDHVACALDLVKPGENGFIYPARDIEKLSNCLYQILSNPELREKMKKKSAEIISHWGLPESVAGLQAACESLCAA